MNNSQVVHAFFYQEKTGKTNGKAPSCHFENEKFFSYGTIIGQIVKGKNNKNILITSYNSHSNTTAKHLSALRYACPYDIVELNTIRGQSSFYIEEQVKKSLEYLSEYDENLFSKKDNRDEFTNKYESLEKINNLLYNVKFTKKIKNKYESIHDESKIKELKSKIKEKQKKEHEKLEKELKSYIKNNNFSQLCGLVYSRFSTIDNKLKAKLKKYIQPDNDVSIIYFNGDYLKTSQNIKVDKVEACVLIRLWKNNKLKHGMTILGYTVLEVNKDFIKVGCHKITTDNLNKLYNEM